LDIVAGEPAGRVRRLVGGTRDFLTRSDEAGAARRSAAIALIIRLLNAALAYVAQVVLARLMHQYEYGVFAYTWVWFLVFGAIATIGFGDSPLRFIAQLRARGEEAYLRGFIRFSLVVTAIGSVAFGALLIALVPLADGWIEHAYVLPLAIMAICIPFACLQAVLEAIGRSYNWTIPALLPVYVLRHGLLLVFMVAAVKLGFEANAVNGFVCLILTLAVSLLYQAASILMRLRREVAPGPRAYKPGEWVRGSLPFAVIYAAQHLSSFADVLVLSFFVQPGEIAIYFAATRVIHVVNLIPFAATVGTAHLFSASHTLGDHDHLQRLCRHVALATFVISLGAVAVIVGAGDWLLHMFGDGFEAGYTPLIILAIGVMVRVATGPAEDVLNMTGNGGVSASTYLIIIGVSVVLAVALIIPFGLNGAAAASAIALVLRGLWLAIEVRLRLKVDTTLLTAMPALRSMVQALGVRREIHAPAD
jgi:O-antigen/teichoic acid export membrane protein